MATPSLDLLDALGQNQDNDEFSYLSPELRRQMRLSKLFSQQGLLSPAVNLRLAGQSPQSIDSIVKSAQQPLQKTDIKTRLTRSLFEPNSVFEKSEPSLLDRITDKVSEYTAEHPKFAQAMDEWFRPEAIPEDASESELFKHVVKTPVLPPVVTKPIGRGLYSALSGDWMLPDADKAHEAMKKDYPSLAAFGEGTKEFLENSVGGLLTPQNIATLGASFTPAGPYVVGAQIPEMVGSTIESGQKFGKSLSEGDIKGATSSGLETLAGGLMTLLGTGYAAKGLAGSTVRPKPTADSFVSKPAVPLDVPNGIELSQNPSTGIFEKSEPVRPAPSGAQGEILGSGLGSLQKFFEKTGDQLKLENAEKLAKQSGKKISEVLSESGEPISPDLYADAMTRQRDLARAGAKPSLKQRTVDFLRQAKANLVDNLSPIEDALEYSMKKGKDQFTVIPRYRFKNQVGRVLQSGAIAKDFAHRYGLFDVISNAKDATELSRLGQYLIARHHVDVANRGGEIATGRNLLDDVNMLNAYDEQNPSFKKKADQVSQYSQKLLELKRDSGLISEESYNRLKEAYPHYVPLERIFAPEETPSGRGSSEAAASLSSTSAQRRLKGSTREIDDPFVTLLAQTGKIVHEAEVNKAAETIVHSMTFPDNPLGVVPVKNASEVPSNKGKISVFENGEKKFYQVEPWVEESAKRLNSVQLGLAERMINLSSKLSKMGMTGMNIPFVGSNFLKDIRTAFVNAPSWRASIKSQPWLAPITTVKSFMDVIGHGKWMQEMDRQGASYSLMDLSKEALPKNIKDVRRRSGLRVLSYPLHSPLATLEHFIGSTEKVTRQNIFRGEFERWKKEGMNDEDARSMAAEAARRTTAPFERRGNYGRAINALMLFAGAEVQGLRATVGAFKDRPFSTTAKWTMAIALPTIITTLYNLSDEKRKAIYQKIDPFEKENSQILIGPDAEIDPLKKVATGVLKLPVTPNLAKSTTMIRQLIEHYYADAPAPTIRQAIDAALGTVTPLSTQANELLSKFTPQPIKPELEVYTNKNFFTGKPIVPASLQDAPPAEQAYPWTSGTAKQIGGLLGTSPLNVEHVIQGHGGGVGMQLLHFADQLQNLVRPSDKQIPVGGQGILDSFKRRLFQASARSLSPAEQAEVDQMSKYNALSKGEDFELKKTIRDKAARQIEAAVKSPENKKKLESVLTEYFDNPAETGSLEDREMKETRKQYSRIFGAPATGYFHTLKPDAKANYLFFEKAFEKIKELPAEARHSELERLADQYGVSDSVLNRMLDLDDEMVKGKFYLNKIKPPSIDERIEKQQNKQK